MMNNIEIGDEVWFHVFPKGHEYHGKVVEIYQDYLAVEILALDNFKYYLKYDYITDHSRVQSE